MAIAIASDVLASIIKLFSVFLFINVIEEKKIPFSNL